MPRALSILLSVYGVVFVAELPDKTALAALVLATRHRALAVLVGTAAALTVQSVVAVAAGQALSLLPARIVHVVSGLVFLASAAVMALRRQSAPDAPREGETGPSFWKQAWLAFGVIFVAEWGDLTQLATAALAARYAAPVLVLAGATAALWSVAAIAVLVGHRAGKMLSPVIAQRVAAVVLAGVGVALLVGLI